MEGFCFAAYVSTVAGKDASAADGVAWSSGQGTSVYICAPQGVAIDSLGTVYSIQQGTHILTKVNGSNYVSVLAGDYGFYGTKDGMGTVARFYGENGLTVDLSGNVFVATYAGIRKVTSSGQ
jgi:hypothetical protein